MCKLVLFMYRCGATKYKVCEPCEHAATDVQGINFCRLDPHPHSGDGIYRDREVVYGPGICGNDTCRRFWSVDPKASAEDDDQEFDMSPEACAEREERWYRQVLTTDQQLDCLNIKFPVPLEEMSKSAQAHLYWASFHSSVWLELDEIRPQVSPEQIAWHELNPRYMNQAQLMYATASLLPQSVTDTRARLPASASPRKPIVGPFKLGDHRCKLRRDFCRDCGKWNGPGVMPSYTVHGGDYERAVENSMMVPCDWSDDEQRYARISGLRDMLPPAQDAQNGVGHVTLKEEFHFDPYTPSDVTDNDLEAIVAAWMAEDKVKAAEDDVAMTGL